VKLGPLLASLHGLEAELSGDYRAIGERHATDHDIYHQCHTFALQCERHVRALEPHAPRYGEDVEDDPAPGFWNGLLERVQRQTSALLGREPQTGLLLLRDLRALYLAAEEASITWVMAGQAAQALRDGQLLRTVSECHAETELQVKWLTTRIKVGAPQALVAG
jgi:hypothetical protein